MSILESCITEFAPSVGLAVTKSEASNHGFTVVLTGDKVILTLNYEMRDRYLSATYHGLDTNEKLAKASAFEYLDLVRSQDSLFLLLHKRVPEYPLVTVFDITDKAETGAAIKALFVALKRYAPDVLEGKALGLARSPRVPPVRIWQKSS